MLEILGENEYGDPNSPSCSAVLQLSPGDTVSVISGSGYPVGCADCTGFTGFLIKAYG